MALLHGLQSDPPPAPPKLEPVAEISPREIAERIRALARRERSPEEDAELAELQAQWRGLCPPDETTSKKRRVR